jgi:hypothetical protein
LTHGRNRVADLVARYETTSEKIEVPLDRVSYHSSSDANRYELKLCLDHVAAGEEETIHYEDLSKRPQATVKSPVRIGGVEQAPLGG